MNPLDIVAAIAESRGTGRGTSRADHRCRRPWRMTAHRAGWRPVGSNTRHWAMRNGALRRGMRRASGMGRTTFMMLVVMVLRQG